MHKSDNRMDAIAQFFVEWGYVGLFLSAFIAGSILPFSSEAVMVILAGMGLDPVGCLIAASLGNTLGGMTCYWIGSLGRTEWITRIGITPRQLARARKFLAGRGALMGLLRLPADHRRGACHRPRTDAQQRVAHGHLDACGQGAALCRHPALVRRGRIALLSTTPHMRKQQRPDLPLREIRTPHICRKAGYFDDASGAACV